MVRKKPVGWTKHPREHALAAHGISSRANGIPGISSIDAPRSFGGALKRYMKDEYGVKVWARDIKSTRPFDKHFYEIGVEWREGETLPNEFRKEIVEKLMPHAKITNLDNINYGNIRSTHVTLTVEEWKRLLEED